MSARDLVIGAGMAGLGAARALRDGGREYLVVEKRTKPGGHTSSWTDSAGFTFDEGPHISFTTSERVKGMLAASLDGRFEERRAAVNNYWRGRWIRHPAQCNLNALPDDLVVRILCDYHEACLAPEREASDYAEWLIATYGRTFATTFPMEYGLKYHTAPAERMTTDWLGPRMYRPKPEEVFRGAITGDTEDVHYITTFRYPTDGGFATFLEPLWRGLDIALGQEVVRVDPLRREVELDGGRRIPYENLISSMPLPELLRRLPDVPGEVREAGARLACSECVVVNLGIDRADISPCHWTYFYDREVVFTRVCFPHMFSPANAPPGCGSIQAEIYFSSKYRPRTARPQDLIEPVKRDLRACGLLKEGDRVLSEWAMLLPYANIIFDTDRASSLDTVHGYLDELGILYCGRYGDWGYMWTDESFLSGERAAGRILQPSLAGGGG